MIRLKKMYYECDTRMNFNTEDASVEDAFLPKTHAVMQLLDKIDIIAKSINKHLVMGDEAWTHLVEPNQSTMFHTHQDPRTTRTIFCILGNCARKKW